MRNIFLFIRRYSNLLLFLVLQIISLYILFHFNKYHEAVFMGVASEVTGRINEKYNTVEYYFQLKQTNDALVKENQHLRSLLKENYESADTSRRILIDSLNLDSLKHMQKYVVMDAKVVGSFTTLQNNIIMVHRGRNQGVKPDMAVISPQGIVGRVLIADDNFSTVLCAISRQFKVNAKLKKGDEKVPIEWDGKDSKHLLLRNISTGTKVEKGDTVITSDRSSIFPSNIVVGTVDEILKEPSSNFLTLKLKTATNFYNVQYVYIIENLQQNERKRLQDSTAAKY